MSTDDRTAGTVFVGRVREMDDLRARLDEATAGRTTLTLLSGEAGIGKTRLAEELEGCARSQQVRVLWGRCDEIDGAPAFWPWIEVLRAQLSGRDDAPVSTDLAELAVELRDRDPSVSRDLVLPPEQARFQLFDRVATVLGKATARQPLLVVLEDVHWADAASLRLLQFVVRHTRDARLCMLATHRELEADARGPAASILAELAAEQRASCIRLTGLTNRDVARYVEVTARLDPSDALVGALYERTEGHPFFLKEIVRLLAIEGRLRDRHAAASLDIPVPRTIRDVIGTRLHALSRDCLDVVSVAAVIGRRFSIRTLAELTNTDSNGVYDLLDVAVRARVVDAVAGSADDFSFCHALIRETLYQELSPARRVGLHRRIGELLERSSEGSPDRHLSELAHHFSVAALSEAELDKAIDYLERAGNHAVLSLAYEEGARLYCTALDLGARKKRFDASRRCRLLVALGSAQKKAGQPNEAAVHLREAAALAREHHCAELLAEAVLAFGGLEATSDLMDDGLVDMLESALAILGDGALRVRVLARLALELYHSPDAERRLVASREALEMARRAHDAPTLAYALHARHGALLDPRHLEERLAIATELLRVAGQAGDPELLLSGHMWRLLDLLEQGDIPGVDSEIDACHRLGEMLRQPLYVAAPQLWRGMRALLDGRVADAEALGMRALSVAPGVPRLVLNAQVLLFLVRAHQGRHRELEPAVRALTLQSSNPVWRAGLAWVAGEIGNLDEARAELQRFADSGFNLLRRDVRWLPGLAYLAAACARLRTPEYAAALYALLAAFAGRNIVVGMAAACLGPVDHYLGLLAGTSGRWDEAEGHFATASELSLRLGARPRLADTRVAWAAMLLERGHAGDREEAVALLAKALDDAEALGMARLVEDGRALLVRARAGEPCATPVVGKTATDEPLAPHEARLRREGDYWTVAFDGMELRLKDARGLHYIAHLLGHPDQAFHVLDLVGGPGAPRLAGSMGPVLDARARSAYQRRLAELDEALGEAESLNDLGRAAAVREEIGALEEQLAIALGLGGRSREVGSPAERARSAVTHRINAVLRKLRREHPALARHLSVSIRTGTSCVYAPDPMRPVRWTI